MARFGLIGASGYIAPRHMEAVRNVGGELVTILDPNDSVGVIDRYHPKATYFSEYERFDREVEMGVPSVKGRKKILKIHTRNMPLAKDVNLDELAEKRI